MGTWSITPNTLASIDNNGKAIFQEHTSQVVYTIKYTSDTCGTVTKQFTVYPCSPVSCDCSTFSSSTSGNRVPSSTGSTEYVVGYYTGATNCSDPITLSHRSGVDFLGNLRASNGTIYATVKAANNGNERSSTYYVRQSNCEDYFTAYQSAGSPTPVCSSSTHRLGSCVTSDGGSNILIGTYDSMEACSGSWTTRGTLPWWISNVSFSNGNIYATLSQNASASERTGTVLTYLSDIGDDYFDVTQCGTGACDCNAANLSITGITNISHSGGETIKIANFTSNCYPNLEFEWKTGHDFISKYSVRYTGSTKQGEILARVQPNTSSVGGRGEEIYAKISGTSCTTFIVTQDPAPPIVCDCDTANVQVGTTAITLGNEAYSTGETTFTRSCTVYINNNEAEGWLDVNATDSKLEFNTSSVASAQRSANVYIDDVNGNHCKTIKVTQEGSTAFTMTARFMNNTDQTVYFSKAQLMRSGTPIVLPNTGCKSILPNSQHEGWEDQEISGVSPTETLTITGAMVLIHGLGCENAGTMKSCSVDKTTIRHGDTIIITYNG